MSEQSIESAFNVVLKCEDALFAATTERKKAEVIFGNAESEAKMRLREAWTIIETMMAETGEYELEFSTPAGQKYIVNWSTPRQSVKVSDVDALPEELIKIEKKPKLKEIGERLKQGWQTNAAKFELGEKHLCWRCVKGKSDVA